MPEDKKEDEILDLVIKNIENGVIDPEKIDNISDAMIEKFYEATKQEYIDGDLRIIYLIMILANFTSEIIYTGVISCAKNQKLTDHEIIEQLAEKTVEDCSKLSDFMLKGLMDLNLSSHIQDKKRVVH